MIRALKTAAVVAAVLALVVVAVAFTRPPHADGLTLLGLLLTFIVIGCGAAVIHLENPNETDHS
ncbi:MULTISPECIES: hypothetical protein [unclassified Cryobacterium]|uniref:hypothetical protein n=1 Tax=unclassified Cryobacterium TaxID=2649013 RepID=UPI002AB47F9D|nr:MULTISPECIES: hypothetical protein [unclassified Cryobacterium]MDY7542645.1 hypothetical protein [Cryobacterium sp. 5B3]MEB0264765.1 hypothetical protein [Cryobacterium sp. 10I5]MEB0273737.1 hypothetical protein [Cryobacterium sp. 5B3]